VLAFRVIKIEYRRVLQQDAIPASRPPFLLPSFRPIVRETASVHSHLSRSSIRASFCPCPAPHPVRPATTKSPISISAPAFLPGSVQNVECDVNHSKQTTEEFLPGTTTAPRGLRQGTASCPEFRRVCPEPQRATAPESEPLNGFRQGTALAVPSLVCPNEGTATQFHSSFRAASPARAFAWALDPATATVNSSSLLPGSTTAQTYTLGARNSAFLTGLPRALFAKGSGCSRPFSNRFWVTNRNRRNSLKTNDEKNSNRGQNAH
jgi:hypothetical protein